MRARFPGEPCHMAPLDPPPGRGARSHLGNKPCATMPRESRSRLAPVRLGLPALLHPRHDLRLRALFRRRASRPIRSTARACGAMRPRRPGSCSPSCRRCWAPSPMRPARRSRGSPPAASCCSLASFALWFAAPGQPHAIADRARRLCHRHGRGRGRGGVQQCHDPEPRAAGALRPPVRHRLGDRLSAAVSSRS